MGFGTLDVIKLIQISNEQGNEVLMMNNFIMECCMTSQLDD